MSGINIYKLVDDKPVLVGYIKSNSEVDEEVIKKIREKYSLNEELKILRLASSEPDSFANYNEYVEQCRLEGKEIKNSNSLKRADLKQIEIYEDEITRQIFTEQ